MLLSSSPNKTVNTLINALTYIHESNNSGTSLKDTVHLSSL